MHNHNYRRPMGNVGYAGNSGSGQQEKCLIQLVEIGKMGAPQRRVEIVETGNTQTENTMVMCYNCNGKGHLANACPKPRVRG